MFRADVDGVTLTCDLKGLIGSNFVMRDRQTGSDWQQATGEAIAGPLKGKRLTMVPFVITTWGEWRDQHPQTLALVPEPSHQAQYLLMKQNQVTSFPAGNIPGARPLRDDSRLPTHEQVLGLEVGDAHKAYPLASLRGQNVLNDWVGSAPVLLLHSDASDMTTAFSRLVNGRTLTFHEAGPGAAELIDNETGSKWNRDGLCISGKLRGEKLQTIIPLPSFWFSWAEFHADTEIFSAKPH